LEFSQIGFRQIFHAIGFRSVIFVGSYRIVLENEKPSQAFMTGM